MTEHQPGTGPRARIRTHTARLLLRPFLGKRDAAAVVHDLEELSRGRGWVGSRAYFWRGVAGYPVRVGMEWVLNHAAAQRPRGGGGGMDGLRRDIGYALRSLRRSPGFTLTTVAILALSMGAATAIFSVVDRVLLDPLPLDEPDRLVSVWLQSDAGERARMTPGNLRDLQGLTEVFSSVAGFQGSTSALSTADGIFFVRGGSVTPEYFLTLGIHPLLGETFAPVHGELDGPPAVVIGEALWRRAFSEDPGIVGQLVDLNGEPFRVLGIVPTAVYPTTVTVSAELPFTADNQDYFVPRTFSDEMWATRRSHILGAVGRLRADVTPEQADAALATLSTRLRESDPFNAAESLLATRFVDEVVGDVRFALITLLGTVGLVLLIAAVNVSALFLLRGDDRSSEIDIRLALGSSGRRLVGQLLIESSLIAIAASAAAVFVARGSIRIMQSLVPFQIPRFETVVVQPSSIAVMVAVGAILALILGLAPAARVLRHRTVHGVRSVTQTRAQRRLHSSIVGFQAALGVTVLVGAFLLTRSFQTLRSVDPGFSERQAWVFPVSGAGERMLGVLSGVRELPGVASAAIGYDHPLVRNWGDSFIIEDRDAQPDAPRPSGSLRAVGEGYFETVGIGVIEGEIPRAADLLAAPLAVVNESLVEAYFPEGDAVGSQITVPSAARMFGEGASRYTIAAVVEDVRFLGPERPSEPAFYLPLAYFPATASNLIVRPIGPGVDVVAGVRQALEENAPGAVLRSAQRLDDILADQMARPRFNMTLLVTFAGMALVLCGLGAYGLVGRTVVSRLREIGIRMALGAQRKHLARNVVMTALRPTLLGGAAGIAVAWATGGVLRSLLYEIGPGDPVSYVLSALFLTAVGTVAAVVPTVWALAVDPARTLREE